MPVVLSAFFDFAAVTQIIVRELIPGECHQIHLNEDLPFDCQRGGLFPVRRSRRLSAIQWIVGVEDRYTSGLDQDFLMIQLSISTRIPFGFCSQCLGRLTLITLEDTL
jgi:hypothetical protein